MLTHVQDTVEPCGRNTRCTTRTLLSVVTPAFNEATNLGTFHQRLTDALAPLDVDWEWLIIDDNSSDRTFETIQEISATDRRVRAIRLSRNYGSPVAAKCGLDYVGGDCAVVLAADLQDPPEEITNMLRLWREGFAVVWAARRKRHGESWRTKLLSRCFYFLMRKVAGLHHLPPAGADFCLVDKIVVHALRKHKEKHVSFLFLVMRMGFSQVTIEYEKQARLHGESGWTLSKKITMAIDAITAFSYLPIRIMSLLGSIFALCGMLLAADVVIERILGTLTPGTGYASLMTVMLLGFGFIMTFFGILGEYLWRALDEVRNRPSFLIEKTVGMDPR